MNDATRPAERRLHGAWAKLTLDTLLTTAVGARPGRRSFSDAPDIATWSDLKPKATNTGELGALVDRFARQISTLGLKAGDHVLVAMPNCVDGVAALLGLIAAGYVPCPVSVVAQQAEIVEAAEAVGARAIVTVNRYADLRPSEQARMAASRYYGLRFVCAFGPGAPNGVVSLDDWQDGELSREPLPENSSTQAAIVTFDRTPQGLVPHGRSHAQVISDALALSACSGLTSRGSIITTFAPVSAAGFIATVAAPLISGTMVALHGPFDAGVLRAQLTESPESIVVLPAAVENEIRAVLGERLKDTIIVTRDLGAARPGNTPGRVTELVSLGEAALLSLLRDRMRSRSRLPRVYTHPVSTALPRGMAQIEITLSPRGRLALQGFGVAGLLQAEGGTASATGPVETRWLGHGDGPDHIATRRDDDDGDSEAAGFAAAVAAA